MSGKEPRGFCSDHQVRGWEQTDHTRDGEDAGGGCHTTPPAWWELARCRHVPGNVGKELPGNKAGEQAFEHSMSMTRGFAQPGTAAWPRCEDGASLAPACCKR